MTVTTSSEYWTTDIDQVRQTLRNIENLKLTLRVAPPRLTHTDILIREVQDLDRALEQVRTLTHIFALTICTSCVVGGSIVGAFTQIPTLNVATAIGLITSGIVALWACITFSLRNA
jgi:hypothetical protein